MNKKLKTILKFLAVTMLSVFFFVAIAIGAFVYWWTEHDNEAFAKREFNYDYWHNPEQKFYVESFKNYAEDWCLRGSMYADLEKNYLPKLKTMDEVIELLGAPDHGRKYWGLFRDKKCLRYDLGSCNIASHPILLICLNKDKEVIDYFKSSLHDFGESIIKEEVTDE